MWDSYVSIKHSQWILDQITQSVTQSSSKKFAMSFHNCYIQFDVLQSMIHHRQETGHIRGKQFVLHFEKCVFQKPISPNCGFNISNPTCGFNMQNVREITLNQTSIDEHLEYYITGLIECNQQTMQTVMLRFPTAKVFLTSQLKTSLETLHQLRGVSIWYQPCKSADETFIFNWMRTMILNNDHLRWCLVPSNDLFRLICSDASLSRRNFFLDCLRKRTKKDAKSFLFNPSALLFTPSLTRLNTQNKWYNENVKWIRSIVGVMHLAEQTKHAHRESIVDILLAFIIPLLSPPKWFSRDPNHQSRLCIEMYKKCLGNLSE